MRTTVTISDALLVEAKTRAAASGRTLNQVIDDALRAAFARQRAEARSDGPALPVLRGSRLIPGVDLDDSAALIALMERGEP